MNKQKLSTAQIYCRRYWSHFYLLFPYPTANTGFYGFRWPGLGQYPFYALGHTRWRHSRRKKGDLYGIF